MGGVGGVGGEGMWQDPYGNLTQIALLKVKLQTNLIFIQGQIRR